MLLIAILISVVMGVGSPVRVAGFNWGSSNCGTNPATSYCIHNNDAHTYHFTASVSTTMRNDTNYAAEVAHEPTQLSISSTADANNTDVVIKMFDYGDSGYAGATLCPIGASKFGTNPRVVCRPQELRYNTDSSVASWFDSAFERRYVACHELGHTVGLRHSGNVNSCMYTLSTTDLLDGHDQLHINNAY